MYIAVAGNIGVGKSTLVELLCRTYGIKPFFEPNEENPYLTDFYADMSTWAFHSQVFFLSHKFRIHRELDQTPGIVVQDRTIYEDAEVFATALHQSGRMSDRDWKTYAELYHTICSSLRPPDLMIYLKCSIATTRKRIKLRGRPSEQAIETSYLKLLQKNYDDWLTRWSASDVLLLDTDRLDYITDLVDRLDVLDRIERRLPAGALLDRRAVPSAGLAASAAGPPSRGASTGAGTPAYEPSGPHVPALASPSPASTLPSRTGAEAASADPRAPPPEEEPLS